MEREVGEIFDYKGKKLQVEKTIGACCDGCFFDQICSTDTFDISGVCDEGARNDGNDVYFKEMNEIMTREEMKDLLPVMKAFADGKTIEYSSDGDLWIETDTPDWCSNRFYRIKKEPQYRPFKTKEECWDEMHCHSDFGWVIRIDTGIVVNIATVHLYGILFDNYYDCVYTFKDAFKYYKFTDGTPFGIKE